MSSNNHIAVVYILTNIINNKIYIGETSNFAKRMSHYRCTERRYKRKNKGAHDETPIYQAILKYGFNNFSIGILTSETADPKLTDTSYRRSIETAYIKKLDTTNPDIGYNVIVENFIPTSRKPRKSVKHTTATKVLKSTPIFVYDQDEDYTMIYLGHKSAAQLLGISDRSIVASAANNGKSIKGKYVFKINIDKRIKNITNIVEKKCEHQSRDINGCASTSLKGYLHAIKRVNDYCEITGFATVDYDKVVTPILKKYNIDL